MSGTPPSKTRVMRDPVAGACTWVTGVSLKETWLRKRCLAKGPPLRSMMMRSCLKLSAVTTTRSPTPGGLALLIEHLTVLFRRPGGELAVGLEREARTHGQGAVGEALFGLQIAHQLALAALAELSAGKREMGGGELGIHVCGGGLFADHEDLSAGRAAHQRSRENWEEESARAPGHEGTSDNSHSAPIRCALTSARPAFCWFDPTKGAWVQNREARR